MRVSVMLVLLFVAFVNVKSVVAQEVQPPTLAACHDPAPIAGPRGPIGPRGPVGLAGPVGPAGEVPEYYLWVALAAAGLALLALGIAIGNRPAPAAPAPVVIVNHPGAAQAPVGPPGP